jgi:hypothetical protein
VPKDKAFVDALLCLLAFNLFRRNEMFEKVILIIFFRNLNRESFFKFSPIKSFVGRAHLTSSRVSKERESTPDVGFDLIFCVNKSEKKFFTDFFQLAESAEGACPTIKSKTR